MPSDSLFTATITKLSHEGRGIARLKGKTQFIDNALPEEVVQAQRIKSHSKYDEAIAKEIISASPHRVTPPCPYYLRCGGCRLQHLATPAQILFKQELLQEQLKHIGHCVAEEWLLPLQAQPFAYRHKARFAVHYSAQQKKIAVGFKQRDDHHIVDLTSCIILHPNLARLLPYFSELISTFHSAQKINEISCAMGDETVAVILHHTAPFVQSDAEKLIVFAKQHAIALYTQSGKSAELIKWQEEQSSSLLTYTLPNYQLKLAFQPNDFTQINSEMNALMIEQMITLLALEPTDQVLDLFCGMGNLSLPIARFTKQVWGIEGSAKMTEQATHNAIANQLENTQFITANLKQPIELAKRFPANKVVLDPPRTGAIEILPALIALKPERLVYISCNPATLARDAAYLIQNGYALSKAGVMDMFPQTQHVESIALFTKI